MGKTLREQQPRWFFQGNDPSGCMRGVLHVLNYQNWRQIKKRLPYKKGRSGSSKHASKANILGDDTNALKKEISIEQCDVGNEDPIVDNECSTTSKGSIANRLKVIISDEISKLKSRHHRSSTCPTQSQMTRTDSIHHLQPFYDDIIAVAKLHEQHLMDCIEDISSSTSSHVDSAEPPLNDQKLEECDAGSPLKLKQFEKQVDENSVHNLVRRNQFNLDSSTHHAEMLDALDLVNTNKDLLKTSSSWLVHHCQNEKAIENDSRFSKTVSFPSIGSSNKIGSRLGKFKLQQEGFLSCTKEDNSQNFGEKLEEYKSKKYFRSQSTPTIAAKYRADGILKLNQAKAITTTNQLRKNGHNQVVIKRFKDLRHKIKHAIKEGKWEKHRIAMDAILDKIPHRHGFSKDLKKEILDQTKDHYRIGDSPRSSYESNPSLPSSIKSEQRNTSRTSSFSESLDRYCQLYECSFNKEAKNYNDETSILPSEHGNSSRMGAMKRIFSLPNIKYTETISDSLVEQSNIKFDLNFNSLRDLDKASISNDEQGKEVKREPVSTVELDVDIGDNMITHSMEFESKSQVATTSITKPEVGTISVFDTQVQESRHSPLSKVEEEDLELRQTHFCPTKLEVFCEKLEDSSMDTSDMLTTKDDKSELSCNFMKGKTLRLEVNDKDRGEFDYVKYILDISGCIQNESVGIWDSEDQLLDRSMLEEVKDDVFFGPKRFGSEESRSCYQMLLFDLANEILMEIYAKSYAYYPAKIRAMLGGHHVLEEVWGDISWYLNFSHEVDDHGSLDYVMSRDLAKSDGWTNIQNEVECVGLELENLIFDHVLDEIISL